MTETTTEVRADIEQTRARMSGAIAELERKVDVTQRVKDHPWTAAWRAGARVASASNIAPVRPMAMIGIRGGSAASAQKRNGAGNRLHL